VPIILPDPDKSTVLLDADGVLINTIGGALHTLRDVPGHRDHAFIHDDVTGYKMEHCLGLSDVDAKHWLQLWCRPGFCAGLPPYPAAVEALPELMQIANVFVVTAPFAATSWTAEREWGLKEHFGIDRARVSHSELKWLFRGDMLVDDKVENLEPWWAHNPNGLPVLWKQRYNVASDWTGMSTNDWNDIIKLVRR
jgi:5'(3')-deoxyribonucleotidase